MAEKILIVDDEPLTRKLMANALASDFTCLTAADTDQALAQVIQNPDLALLVTDFKMPGKNGLELIREAKALCPNMGCVIITAFGEIELAVQAMKEGADDFLTKPITDLDQMKLRLKRAIHTQALTRRVKELETKLDDRGGLENFTGDSEPMREVYRLIRLAAPSSASVLVSGPSGTGKELVADALHRNSLRAKGPFVAVECAALSPTLIESELFGYEPNAFTGAAREGKIGRFEAANGGTLFLDEITEIDLATQVKLLRVLESRKIQRVGGHRDIPCDFRLIAATNRNLAAYVAEGKFREDLYYRLNVIEIRLPALKDRPGDIALLTRRFLNEYAHENRNPVTDIEPAALELLTRYTWPGNVRQLRNTIERMIVLSGGGVLTAADVPAEIANAPVVASPAPAASDRDLKALSAPVPHLASPSPSEPPATAAPLPPAEPLSLAESEKARIREALAHCHGNKTKAAEVLGISRRTLHRKIKEWSLES